MMLRSVVFAAAMLTANVTFAHDFTIGKLHVSDLYAGATAPGQPAAAVYLTIENKGDQEDQLISISTAAAKSTELHTMSMSGDVMKMREVDTLTLKPGAKIAMAPGGGYHLMLIGLQRPLAAGQQIALRLKFKKAGILAAKVDVVAPGARR